ncbi:MAG: cysteine--tRNA ligase [Conexivisphaera sp.]
MQRLRPSFFVSDTLSGAPVEFTAPRELRMYVCGLTVYDYAHIGHARTMLVFDVLHRMAISKGFYVRYLQNFTDIDDKIIDRASKVGVDPLKFAEKFMVEALHDMDLLNIRRPTLMPRATQHISAMQRLIQGLIERGHAYVVPSGVYFSVRTFPEYGKLSKKRVDQLMAGARVEPDPHKRDPADFALWKVYDTGPLWDSPWGKGRPGWHIECSAMINEHLGETIDIHGGGADLVFPHHENEIAQSESYTGKPLARAWVHVEMLNLRSEKMAKSLGNVIRIRDAVEMWGPNTLRTYLLSSNYRSPLEFSVDGLVKSHENWRIIESAAYDLVDYPPSGDFESQDARNYFKEFDDAISADLDTPRAISTLVRFSRFVGRLSSERRLGSSSKEVGEYFWTMFDVLGYRLPPGPPPDDVLTLVERRRKLRSEGRFSDADAIRDDLRARGYELVDLPDRTSVRMVERLRTTSALGSPA